MSNAVVIGLPRGGVMVAAEVVAREEGELARRVRTCRGDRPPIDVAGRTVIIVDDGLATGHTARAAIQALRPWFCAISDAYDDFSQVTDEEVVTILEQSRT